MKTNWLQTHNDLHCKAFSAASVMKADLLLEVRREIDLLLETGASWSEAKEALSRLISR